MAQKQLNEEEKKPFSVPHQLKKASLFTDKDRVIVFLFLFGSKKPQSILKDGSGL